MICGSCRSAGDAKGKNVAPVLIKMLHETCEYPENCPCLHRQDAQILLPLVETSRVPATVERGK